MLHDDWRMRIGSLLSMRHQSVSPRGQATVEELDQRIVIDGAYNLLDVPSRGLNYRFAVAEWIWMSFGRSDVDSIARYNSIMRQFSDDGRTLTGAYGPHINAQRFRVIEKLRADHETRQAVIEIPRPHGATKDEPCTLSLQFLLRHNHLNLIVTMRSSDAWLGIPYDLFTFGQFLNVFAGELGVNRGFISMRMGSSHLYERDFDAARRVLRTDEPRDTLRLPQLPGRPPYWLEHVLMGISETTPTSVIIDCQQALDDHLNPWQPYASVLLAHTSDEARSILRAVAVR